MRKIFSAKLPNFSDCFGSQTFRFKADVFMPSFYYINKVSRNFFFVGRCIVVNSSSNKYRLQQ